MTATADAAPDMTRLVLIRHGESRSTVDRIVGGHAGCTGLSDRGVRQAEALRDRLAKTGELAGAAALLTSILPRAIETADIVAPALGGEVTEQRCELCEIHPGEGDGLSWEDFTARYRPEGLASGNPYRAMAPGGESWAGFFTRASEALLQAADDYAGRTVVIVCHGGVIEASFAALGNLPLRRPFDVRVENTSLTSWTYIPSEGDLGNPGHRLARWRLDFFNDSSHLAGLD
ncbi:MAG TPA: histidine phosphatase family protein [Acidimicrobiia bacterium]|nr:histidine phosphatase family protein [Acidimicrobiia bacterium]